jgi:hypothetical protein
LVVFLFGGGIWFGVVEWAMRVPDCIVLCIAFTAFIAFTQNATDATLSAHPGAFLTILLGSKYQWYAGTYRGRGWWGGLLRFALWGCVVYRVTMTGHGAFSATPWLTLPNRASSKRLRPLAPMTMTSKLPSLAVFTIWSTTLPSSSIVSAKTPSA